MNLLIVEDDVSIASGLKQALQREGFAVNVVYKGNDALSTIDIQAPDLVILDLGLPDMDGLSILKKIRKGHTHLPVLILTARANLEDMVEGLDLGADDYLSKPFQMPELLARVRVLERRLGISNSNKLTIGDVSIDTSAHLTYFNDSVIDLSRREYMLLKALMENAGKIHTREALENKLYGWGEEVASNAIEVHIHHLRKKFGTTFIKTIRGVGYTVKKQ